MRGLGVALSVATAGCGFQLAGTPDPGATDAGPTPDMATVDPDAMPPADAPSVAHPLYAAASFTLYAIDVDTLTATPIGRIRDVALATEYAVDGLAFDGTNLLGLTPTGDELLIIDPSTAAVTARRAITPAATNLGGLTVAPAGEAGPSAVVFAGSGNKLARIDVATGAVTTVGTFGQAMTFYSDLAWVKGEGLFATLQSGPCASYCFARVDHTNGTATPFRTNLTIHLYGMSGYRDTLWALNANGPIQPVDMTTGLLDVAFDPSIPWTEAAQ